MRRPIRPEWLIRLARETSRRRSRTWATAQHEPRRATSSAYYAAFHAVALAVAVEALPNASEAERHGYARYVNHQAVEKVCGWISGADSPLHVRGLIDRLRRNQALSGVATGFLTLKEQREAADYDHGADFTRPGTLALVGRADGAVLAIRANSATDDYRAFFGLIALQTAVRTNR